MTWKKGSEVDHSGSITLHKIPYIVTHDSRTIRFPHPDIKEGDSVKIDLEKNQIVSWIAN